MVRAMTSAQTSAMDQITEIMREHFESAVFIFETDADDRNDPTLFHLSYRTAGTFSSALGLVRYAEHKMLRDE